MINNNELDLLLNNNFVVDYSPASLEKEIAQNVFTIFITSKYSVPLDREFGLDVSLLDMPMTTAKALLMNEIVNAIETYEPRVKITQIELEGDMDGKFYPHIKFLIKL